MQQEAGATNARHSVPPACARRCGEAGRGRMAAAAMACAGRAVWVGKAGA